MVTTGEQLPYQGQILVSNSPVSNSPVSNCPTSRTNTPCIIWNRICNVHTCIYMY